MNKPLYDFTKYQDKSGPVFTISYTDDRYQSHELIQCRGARIELPREKGIQGFIEAALKATDQEHDTAKAFRFPVVGVEFKFASGGATYLSGWALGPPKDFHFPPLDKLAPKTYPCPSCTGKDDAHLMTNDYLPQTSEEMFILLNGRAISIRIY